MAGDWAPYPWHRADQRAKRKRRTRAEGGRPQRGTTVRSASIPLSLSLLSLSVPITLASTSTAAAATSSLGPTVWSGRVLTKTGAPAAATLYATAMPNTGSGKLPQVPLAIGTTGNDGEFNLRALPTAALSQVEGTHGSFNVLLQVVSGSTVQLFIRSMHLTTGAGAVTAAGDASPASSLMSDRWATAVPDSKTGDTLTLKGGTPAQSGTSPTSAPLSAAAIASATQINPGQPDEPCTYENTSTLPNSTATIAQILIAPYGPWNAYAKYANTASTEFAAGAAIGGGVGPVSLSYAGTTSETSSGSVSIQSPTWSGNSTATNHKVYIVTATYQDNFSCLLPPYTTSTPGYVSRLGDWRYPSNNNNNPTFGSTNEDSAGVPSCPSGNPGYPVAAGFTLSYESSALSGARQTFQGAFDISTPLFSFTGSSDVGWATSSGYEVGDSWQNFSTSTKHLCAVNESTTTIEPGQPIGLLVGESW